MKQSEADAVCAHLDLMHDRIKRAKDAMRQQNYGMAFDILSEPFTAVQIKVDDDEIIRQIQKNR